MTPENPAMHMSDGVTLRDYVDLRFRETQRAIDKAEQSMTDKFAGINELRGAMKDQAAMYATRAEVSARFDRVDAEMRLLRSGADKAEGKASMGAMLLTLAIAVLGLLIGVAGLLLK